MTDECIETIEEVNPDNIKEDTDYEDLIEYLRRNGMGEREIGFIVDELESRGVILYTSPYFNFYDTYDIPITDNINLLMNELESAYCSWAGVEEDAFDDLVKDSLERLVEPKYAYAVDYRYWYGHSEFAGHSFITRIIGLDDENQVDKVKGDADKIIYDFDELLDDFKEDWLYENKIGGGNWGTPIPYYCSYDDWVNDMCY